MGLAFTSIVDNSVEENPVTHFPKLLATTSLVFVASICQAGEPSCNAAGTFPAQVEGVINNNAVGFGDGGFFGPLPLTSGVAQLKVSARRHGGTYKLTCALSGTPNIASSAEDHVYDHRIVCDDYEQSEMSFNTRFVGDDPLDPKLQRRLCRGQLLSFFVEESSPDPGEPTKGLFSGVTEGLISVVGCTNAGSDYPLAFPYGDLQINMRVEGYVCLPAN
ncbi:MAG: hypothetical protein V5B44_13605 [Candidatus Accumulibacter necessarius]|uniref:hypothetical protein n=1 Tax=Candidatus Accumulibacter necessarius TaxID=2954386 RepID=UPI002FC29855